ncbi:FMN-binding protein [Saccharothrix xinjiangensis]|uniref:FMN-binding protein n=1 Tax=Saccharothrix xinjiangensis TaxID=204798 RepID=A0ABV9XWA5_9PSEU
MRRAVPVLLLTVAGLVPLWRFEPRADTVTAAVEQPAAGQPVPRTAETVEGPLVRTRHGDVQVAVVFEGDRITGVRVVRQPDSAPTRRALPVLVEEALVAQSADVDAVSGATTTSEAYVESLQAALDARG